MKRFIFSMLFCLFAFTSFAMTNQVKKDFYDNTEQTVKAVDIVSVNVVDFQKTNTDGVFVDNSVNLNWKTWQHYFYLEKLTENYNLKFKHLIFYGS